MKRRKLLTVGGAMLVTTTAGCSGDSGEEESEPTEDTETSTDNGRGGNEESESPPVDIVIQGPSSVETGIEEDYTISITNTANRSVDVEYESILRQPAGEESLLDDDNRLLAGEASLPSSERVKKDISMFVPPPAEIDAGIFVSATTSHSGEEATETMEISVEPVRRAWGEEVQFVDGLILSASPPETTNQYENRYGNVEIAPEGRQYVFIEVSVENASGEPRVTPSLFELATPSDQTAETFLSVDNKYEGRTRILDGVTKSGFVTYEINANTDVSNLILYQDWSGQHGSWELIFGSFD